MNLAVSEQSVSIIVPTLNEEENIEPLVSQITACAVPFQEILFVDDHSTAATRDRIRALAESHPIRLIDQDGSDPGLAADRVARSRGASLSTYKSARLDGRFFCHSAFAIVGTSATDKRIQNCF